MVQPNIPAAKRAGLPVDLQRLTAEGDDWLSAEERYALKTHGVCAQTQPHVFMIRIRTSDGVIGSSSARGLARIASDHGRGWVHLTTRQQAELHHIAATDVPDVLAAIEHIGMTTRSSCGHTVRGVLACAYAGAGLDEPFDCRPDARAVSQLVYERGQGLNRRLPSRLNIGFGGCTSCRDHAKTNDLGFVSVIRDGEPGYEVWVGGSLGKSAPTLAMRALPFVPRRDVLAVVDALLTVYCDYGEFDKPSRGRLKFLIRELGREDFLDLFVEAIDEVRARPWPAPMPVRVVDSESAAQILARVPPGGWGSGVRPQRLPGLATVTVNVPLGDIDSDDLIVLADLADEVADGNLYLTRNQNVVFRDVALGNVPLVRDRLAQIGLGLDGADQALDVRVCTGGPVCSLAITPAQAAATDVLEAKALARNSGLRVHISGCMNACAQHQIGDIGYSGGKVTVGGRNVTGYQVWLGGDLSAGQVGRIVGRITEDDVALATGAIIGVWEALRMHGERFCDTLARVGDDAVSAYLRAVLAARWEPGPEPDDAASVSGARELVGAP
jgi:sulfite reductase beta subunit-like hemoprotein